jgi:PKD repeat protein
MLYYLVIILYISLMKPLFVLTAAIFLSLSAYGQGVLIGTQGQTPDPSAKLEVRSQTGGFLIPRMTTAERNAIQSPAIGLQIYNTDSDCMDMYFPSGWRAVACECQQLPSAQFTSNPISGYINNSVQFNASGGSANAYIWTFSGATVGSGSGETASATWTSAGSYNVTLIATAPDGCQDSSSSSITISSCATGSQTFTYSGNIQTFTVPAGACQLTILAEGGQGGNGQSSGTGGMGASIQGAFTNITPGTILTIVVGGQGTSGLTGNSSRGGGGGGGSFVYDASNNLFIAAGGGGGGGHTGAGGNPGLTGTSGGASNFGNLGGSNGNGGTRTTSNGYDGGGGAGWLSNGESNTMASGGISRAGGWTGGGANAYNPLGVNGGFGGGGGAEHGAGGGGGYSGGGGGRNGSPYGAGGGGSFNAGTNQVNQSGVRSGHGRVVISWN